jgi:hypothetical protein
MLADELPYGQLLLRLSSSGMAEREVMSSSADTAAERRLVHAAPAPESPCGTEELTLLLTLDPTVPSVSAEPGCAHTADDIADADALSAAATPVCSAAAGGLDSFFDDVSDIKAGLAGCEEEDDNEPAA